MAKDKDNNGNGNIEEFLKLIKGLIEEAQKENKEEGNKGDK